jgi:hypothetical protein
MITRFVGIVLTFFVETAASGRQRSCEKGIESRFEHLDAILFQVSLACLLVLVSSSFLYYYLIKRMSSHSRHFGPGDG